MLRRANATGDVEAEVDTYDYLTLGAQQRTWSLPTQVEEMVFDSLGDYVALNNQFLARGFYRSVPAPGERPTTLNEFYNAMKAAFCLIVEGTPSAATPYISAATQALEANELEQEEATHAAAFMYLAEVRVAAGQLPEARDAAEKALAAYKRFLTEVRISYGRDDQEYTGFLASGHSFLGFVMGLQGEYEGALRNLEKGLTMLRVLAKGEQDPPEPRLVWALEVYAETLERAQQPEMAMNTWREILRLRERDLMFVAGPIRVAIATTNFKMARTAAQMGDKDLSQHHVDSALKHLPLRQSEASA